MYKLNTRISEKNFSASKLATLFVLGLFLLVPFFSTIRIFYRGHYGGDIFSLYIPVGNEIFAIFFNWICWSLFFILFAILIFRIFSAIKLPKINSPKKNFIHILFFIISLILLLMVALFGIGSIERVEGGGNRLLELLFAAMQPYYLLIIYLLFSYKNPTKLYYFTLFVFFVSVLLSGFVGYVFYIMPVFFYILRGLKKIKLIIIFAVGILLMPLIRFIKFIYIQNINNVDFSMEISSEVYFAFVDIVIDRFSLISELYFLETRWYDISRAWSESFFAGFQSYPGSLFYKVFLGGSVGNINGLSAELITGTQTWNSVFPLISYFNISVEVGFFTLTYALVLIACFAFISSFLFKDDEFLFVSIVPAYLLVFGGWFWPFANFLQALLIAAIIFFVFNGSKKYLKY